MRKLASEMLGTCLLLSIVIGSGVMADRLSGGHTGLALLANTFATVAGLYALIEVFGPLSGAHFNPLVSMVMVWEGRLPKHYFLLYVIAHCAGSLCGTWLAHAMFELPLMQLSEKVRWGMGQWLAEIVATAGLVLVILRATPSRAPMMVASFIGSAYWFTASTSFANPVAVLGRTFSDSFAGISPTSALAFVVAQMLGACLGYVTHRALPPASQKELGGEKVDQDFPNRP